jgi:hypothetical protein
MDPGPLSDGRIGWIGWIGRIGLIGRIGRTDTQTGVWAGGQTDRVGIKDTVAVTSQDVTVTNHTLTGTNNTCQSIHGFTREMVEAAAKEVGEHIRVGNSVIV